MEIYNRSWQNKVISQRLTLRLWPGSFRERRFDERTSKE